MQANEEEEATLLFRIAANDPTLTTLDLLSVDDFGARSLDPVRWDEGSHFDRVQLLTEISVEIIKALGKNTKIAWVLLGPALSSFLDHNPLFWELLGALMKLQNLVSADLHHEEGFLGHEIAGLVKEANSLRSLSISCLRFEEQADCTTMVTALRHHPSLLFIRIGALEFAIGDDFVEEGSATDPNTLASYSLASAISTIPNLAYFSTNGLRFQAKTFVELATKPSILSLSLKNAALSDEHILPMVETAMHKKGRLGILEVLDLSSGPATEHPNVFSQEGWEALFRLAGRDPPIKVTATAIYGEQDDTATTFCLDDTESVQQHLERLESVRLLRLQAAGFNELVPEESLDAAWIDVMENVSDDVKALFRVLVANPTICRSKPRDDDDDEQDDTATTFCLDDTESVQQHLERLESVRLLRLQAAGFNELVPEESLDAAWIDVMEKVNDEVKALYRVIRAHPMLCGHTSSRKRKRKADRLSTTV